MFVCLLDMVLVNLDYHGVDLGICWIVVSALMENKYIMVSFLICKILSPGVIDVTFLLFCAAALYHLWCYKRKLSPCICLQLDDSATNFFLDE
jgi:hypothetical protein